MSGNTPYPASAPLVVNEKLQAAGQQSAEEVVAGWLKSPGHCRNILLPELREIGVGVVVKPSSERSVIGWRSQIRNAAPRAPSPA